MLDVWQATGFVSRAWCLFELYTAIKAGSKVQINIILPTEQHETFVSAIQSSGYRVMDAALNSIQAERATATEPADLVAIRKLVEATPGGFPVLNQMVKQHLSKWCASFGAVQSSMFDISANHRACIINRNFVR